MIFFHPPKDNVVISHQHQHNQPKHVVSRGKIFINPNKPGTARNNKGQTGSICPNCSQDILLSDTYCINNCPSWCIDLPCICLPLCCWVCLTCKKRKCGSCNAEYPFCG